ncbi:MAG: thioredoxin domain-containing protein [Alphaproteobacteria bacterium]|nr:thioredoxin domain-containing protein [Alphaproteobacteria bacterium]
MYRDLFINIKNYTQSYRIELLVFIFALGLVGYIVYSHDQFIKKIFPGGGVTSFNRTVNTEKDFIVGNPNADLFIIEYGDLQCSYCQTMHPRLQKLLRSSYGISGRVAWVWRHGFHIDEVSITKAKATECVYALSPNRYANIRVWTFIEKSLEGGVYETEYPRDRYAVIYKKLGLKETDVDACIKNIETSPRYERITQGYTDVFDFNITLTPYIQYVTKEGELVYESRGVIEEEELQKTLTTYFEQYSTNKRK